MAKFYLSFAFVLLVLCSNAQTITISQETGGVSTSPLVPGATNIAILGIQFDKSSGGMCELDAFTVDLSSDPSGVWTNPRLYRSTDNTFAGIGSETLVSTGSIVGNSFVFDETATFITDFGGSGSQVDRFIFVVVDVAAGLNASTPTIQPSLVNTNVTSAGCTVNAGTVTGTSFSFLGLTIGSLNAGANNLAADPLIAGATGQAIFGFSLTSNGSQTVSVVNVQLSSDPAGVLSGYSLVKSTDADFATTGNNTTVGGLTFTPSASQVSITGLSEAITSTTSNYFLVANVSAGVTGATPNILPSIAAANVTVNQGGKQGTSSGTDYSFAAATTTIGSLNAGANNVATSPIVTGATGRAIFGFSLTSNGTQTATAINVQFSADPTASKYSNYSLVKSVDANFASAGDNSTVGGLTFTPSTSEVVITGLSQSITSTASNYFLVVDVNASASGNIQASLSDTDVTVSAGSLTGSSTGTDYSFTPLTATIGSLNAGANNVATSPIVAGGTGKAVFGFSLTSNGSQTATAINIQFNADPTASKYSNYSLVKSVDANFASTGDNSTVGGLTFTPSATQVAITGLTEALTTTASNYFLVVDVNPAVTGTIQASLPNTQVTVGSGVVAGSATGTNYNFAPLTATLSSLNAGANNVAASPLGAGTTGRAVFGFALASNGTQTVSQINVQLVGGNPSGRWSNFGLVSSTDTDFATSGNNTVVPTSSINVTGVAPFEVQITPTTPIDISTARNLFLVADINPGVTSATASLQATLATANFTVSAGTKTGSSTGTAYSFNTSQSTTITVDYDGQVGPGFIDLGDYNKQSSSGLTTGNSEKIFGISINDADPDSHATNVTSLTFQLSNFANLNAIALFDGTTLVPGTELIVASNIVGNQITFPVSITVGDNSSKIIDVYVTFAPTVTDNQFINVSLTSAIASTAGSGFGTLGTIQSDPAKNKINVVATEMRFTNITAGIIPATDFGFTILATDNLGNQDLNTTGNVTLSKQSGPGTLSSTDAGGLTRAFASGSVSWTQLELTLAGNYTIRANHSGSLPNKDEPITVTSLGIQITGPTNQDFCIGGTYASLNTITLSESDPADFKTGTGVTYSFILPTGFEFNTAITPTPTETGSNVSALTAINFPTNNIARFSYTVSAENSTDAIIISGLQIRYTGSGNVTGQEILRIGGSANQDGNNDTDGNIHGTLSASAAAPPLGFAFTVEEIPGNPVVAPNQVNFSTSDDNVKLVGNPSGGTFVGNGVAFDVVNGFVFSPSAAGPGSHQVTYSYSDPVAPNCVSTTSKTFNVSSTNIIQNLQNTYCQNDLPSSALTVLPAQIASDFPPDPLFPGATYTLYDFEFQVGQTCSIIFFGTPLTYRCYTGPILSMGPPTPSSTTFDPQLPIYSSGTLLFGNYSILVRYRVRRSTDLAILSSGSSQVVTLIPPPAVSFSISSNTFCATEPAVDLVGFPSPSSSPTNDFFTGTGAASGAISNTGPGVWRFTPTNASVTLGTGPKSTSITYTYLNTTTGCSNTSTATMVTVNPIPTTVPNSDLSGNTNTQNICQFSSAPTFTATGGAIYNWYSNADVLLLPNSSSFTPAVPVQLDPSVIGNTTFKVTQTLLGCEGPLTPLTVVAHQPVTLDAGDFGTGGICFNDQIVFTDFNIPASISGAVTNGTWNDLGGGGQFFDVGGVNPDNTFGTSRIFQPTAAQYLSAPIVLQLVSDTPSSINPANPCPAKSDIIVIQVNPVPPAPIANQPPDFCVGDLVQNLTATGTNLKWYTDPGLTNNYASGSPVSPLGVSGLVPSNDDFYVTQSENGCEGPATQVDVVYNPTPAANYTVSNQCFGESLNLIDASTISGGSIVKWGWRFNDGDDLQLDAGPIPPGTHAGRTTGTYDNPMHTYASPNSYTIRLDVESDLGCKNTTQQNIEIGPVPNTNIGFRNLCDGETTEFQYTAGTGFPVGKLALWEWSFDDPGSGSDNAISGSNPADQNPTHIFTGVNSYDVSLRLVTDLGCEKSITKGISILPYVSSFPYRESFEDIAHGWAAESFTDPTELSWKVLAPSGSTINFAKDGANVWFAHDNISGGYFNNERSVVNGPCFDMTQIERPVLSFDYWNDTDLGADGVFVEFSTDGGSSWSILGDVGEGLNWYNQSAVLGLSQLAGIGQTIGQTGWSGKTQNGTSNDGWRSAKFSLDNQSSISKLRIRYVFGTNGDNPAGVDGFAFDNFSIESRNRTILAENFTNTGAPGAIANSSGFMNFNSGVSFNEMVRIQYHTSIGGDDPFNQVNPSAPNARAAFYGVTSPFRGYLDGNSDGTFSQSWANSNYNSRTLVASPLEISISSPSTPAETFNIEAIVNAIDDLDPGQYTVQIAIVEKQVGSESFVLRDLLPDPSGTPLTALTNGSSQTVTVSTHLRNINDPNQVAIIAFVQQMNGQKEVLQAKLLDGLTTPTVVTGLEVSLAELLSVHPNPASNSLTVQLPYPAMGNTSVVMVDQVGKTVRNAQINKGDQSVTLLTDDLAGGIYLIQVEGGKDNMVRKKVMIVHK